MAALPASPVFRRLHPLCRLIVATWLCACSPNKTPLPAATAQDVPPGPSVALPAANGTQPATSGALGTPSEAYVIQATFVRRIPSDAKQVTVPNAKRPQANWLATLNRGEHVRVLEVTEAWLRVQSSDESAGWIKREGVLVGPDIAQATNLAPLRHFTRPDMLALAAAPPVPPGSLLFVLRQKDGFSLVNHQGSAATWVLSDALERERPEVEAAKLLHRARQLSERHDAAAEGLYELARNHYAQTRLVRIFFPTPVPMPVPHGESDDVGQHDGAGPHDDVSGNAVPEPPELPGDNYDAWSAPNAGPPQTNLPAGVELPAGGAAPPSP